MIWCAAANSVISAIIYSNLSLSGFGMFSDFRISEFQSFKLLWIWLFGYLIIWLFAVRQCLNLQIFKSSNNLVLILVRVLRLATHILLLIVVSAQRKYENCVVGNFVDYSVFAVYSSAPKSSQFVAQRFGFSYSHEWVLADVVNQCRNFCLNAFVACLSPVVDVGKGFAFVDYLQRSSVLMALPSLARERSIFATNSGLYGLFSSTRKTPDLRISSIICIAIELCVLYSSVIVAMFVLECIKCVKLMS